MSTIESAKFSDFISGLLLGWGESLMLSGGRCPRWGDGNVKSGKIGVIFNLIKIYFFGPSKNSVLIWSLDPDPYRGLTVKVNVVHFQCCVCGNRKNAKKNHLRCLHDH